MTSVMMSREELKAACLALLDSMAVEHPAGHQGKFAARYLLRSASGERIGLMFEKSEKTKCCLWVERRFARDLMDEDIEFHLYLASSLYQTPEDGKKPSYGRHAALKSMRDLAHTDLVRFTLTSSAQMWVILDHLAKL